MSSAIDRYFELSSNILVFNMGISAKEQSFSDESEIISVFFVLTWTVHLAEETSGPVKYYSYRFVLYGLKRTFKFFG